MTANAFVSMLEQHNLAPLRRQTPHTVQINVGKRCNQACRHCHVDASPARTEMMASATVDRIIELILLSPSVRTVDITGGAPELHPEFRRLVRSVKQADCHVLDRCNLTVLFEPGQEGTIEFLADHEVEIVASLPCYGPENVDQQRGAGVFDYSILALQTLNKRGYGIPDSGLVVNLVYNPSGPFLPPDQSALEEAYRHKLRAEFGIEFNHLYTITNMPIARFQRDLMRQGQLHQYMQLLKGSFNPDAVAALMCTGLVSIDWQGNIFDCDFNQMLNLSVPNYATNIWNLANFEAVTNGPIATGDHCLGCTAGSGSSCGGALA